MRFAPLASTVVLALALSACGTRFSGPEPMRGPAPLQPQPVAPVAAQPLPPPTTAPVTPPPAAAEPEKVASAEPAPAPAASAVEIRKPDLSGAWKLASGGENCQLFMSLTSWTGGYRANARGCGSEELTSISAWNLEGKQVVLKDASGSVVATLYAADKTRFSGQTAISKRGVTVFR